MSEPHARRPSFPGYGVSEEPEGMLPWAWAEERLLGSRNYWVAVTGPHTSPVWGLWQHVAAYERKYDFRPNPGEGWYRVRPRRVLAWREEDYPRSATRFDF